LPPILLPVRNWSGVAVRHIPDGARFDVLDFRYAGRGADNRWNVPGEPTLYLAHDEGVAISEFGRHLVVDRAPDLAPLTIARRIYRVRVEIDALIDLRDHAVSEMLTRELGHPDADPPLYCLDRGLARDVAGVVRRRSAAQGMFVPSMAFLDDPRRWVLVLFLDKLPLDPHRYLTVLDADTTFRFTRRADPIDRS
jgi:RES domain-containing protein